MVYEVSDHRKLPVIGDQSAALMSFSMGLGDSPAMDMVANVPSG